MNERTKEHDRIQQAVSADGTRIAARVRGEGPPIVLLPAGPGDSELSWNRVASYLSERFTCYLLETRGRGPSGDHPDHSPERQVEDVLALVEAIDEPVNAERLRQIKTHYDPGNFFRRNHNIEPLAASRS